MYLAPEQLSIPISKLPYLKESEADEADQDEKEIENDITEPEETRNGNDKVIDEDAARASTSNGEGENSVKVSDVKVAKPCGIDPKCKIEVRRWRQGSYTLLSDAKANNDKYFVDGRLFFNCQDWNIEQVTFFYLNTKLVHFKFFA